MEQAVGYRRRGGEGTLTLRGTVDIFEAQSLRAAALRALGDSKAQTLRLDLAHAERLDVSALQVLCALRRDLETQGRTLICLPVPSAVADACEATGCTL
ncbi:MAG: STAS domain-containing protein [Janthinobacterium lividum]